MTIKYNSKLIAVVLMFIAFLVIIGIYQLIRLSKVHSTFENYYAFRGCASLIQRSDDFGICKLNSGQIIKIVKFNGEWYLDGDLPCGFMCF